MSDHKLPDYLLERLAQGELPEGSVRLRDPEIAARLESLRASDEALLARHPPEAVTREIERRRRAVIVPIKHRRGAWLFAPIGAVAVALLVAVLRPGPEHTQVKGDAALLVYRNRAGHADLLASGASASPGDIVQLGYIRARPVFGVILSVDGAGSTTLHLPDRGVNAARLTADARTLLSRAYELDAAPKFERFFLVSSDDPFVASVALEAARKLAATGDGARTEPLPLPASFAQASFLLLKTSP
jgi:hypothetical protein